MLSSLGLVLVFILTIMGWTKFKSLGEEDNEKPLAIRYEGFYHDMNHRDLAQSINHCLEEEIFKKDVVHRSAGWFSGWSCSKVGNPDVIFSLNYSPINKERFFCHEHEEKIIGKFFNNEIVLNDLEFISNWENEKIRIPTCLFFENILIDIIAEKKVLIHCDAGRDRSGAVSALLIAMAAEESGFLGNFPHYRTQGQNPGALIRLTPSQVNLLSHLSCWTVTRQADKLNDLLGSP